jgi:hypothetical protein
MRPRILLSKKVAAQQRRGLKNKGICDVQLFLRKTSHLNFS